MASAVQDVAVIGGGIVGAATAYALSRRDRYRLVVLEAEAELAQHQSGRNSGVIHSGLYYRPGSSKARLCIEGRDRLYRFCEEHGLPFRRCGKLVIATAGEELEALARLHARGLANGLQGLRRVDREEIQEIEPAAAGIAGLWVPHTGVVDFQAVTATLALELQRRGGELRTRARVRRIRHAGQEILLETTGDTVRSRLAVNCAGLYSDRVARLAGLDPQVRIVPFRGQYCELQAEARHLVRTLIYPVPEPGLPFLGAHFTRTIDHRVLVGPTAVLAFKREGYRLRDISPGDLAETLGFPGFWRLTGRFWRQGATEIHRAVRRRAFAAELQRLVPALCSAHLQPAPAGVRAQALDRQGNLIDDFHILEGERMLHVLNAPSPAATAALAIGEHLAGLAEAKLG